jgi:phospholipid N-methyltransferase
LLQADLEKSVAKTIRKQKDFRCIASLAIVLSGQNRVVLFKDIFRNGSHEPSTTSVLCSAHFMVTDFEQRLDFNPQEPEQFTTKRWLKKGAIPSLDCVVSGPQVQAISARERRQVNICIYITFVSVFFDRPRFITS